MANNKAIGDNGESIAIAYLKEKGYQILHQNYRIKRFEIDIIAQIGNDLVFVEVKTRKNDIYGHPNEFVNTVKANKLLQAVSLYLEKHFSNQLIDYRIDIIGIYFKNNLPIIEHIEDAIWPDLGTVL